MSSTRYVGRHGSARHARPRLSLPPLGGAGVGRTAAKSVAGVGIVLGCGAFVIAPSSAVGSAGGDGSAALGVQQSTASELLADRDATAPSSSRSAQRGAPAAVSAPSSTGSDQSSAGQLGIEAVAKPKPKPEPTSESKSESPEDEPTESKSESTEDESSEPSSESTEPVEERTGSTESSASRSSSRSADSGEESSSGSPQTGNYGAEASALGLGPNAQSVYSAVRSQFPDMTNIGGYRAGDGGDHGSGKAVDVMVTGARGDQVAAWLQQNASSLNIKYVIWKQRIWHPGGSWESMADRGDPTQNHFDHVHVSVN